MSLNHIISFVLICFILGCSTKEQKTKETEFDPIVEQINVDNIELNSALFQELKDPIDGENYKFHSRLFLQTSLINRHVNTLGLIADPSKTENIKRASYSYKKAGEHQKAMQLLQLSIDEEKDVSKLLNNIDYAAWNYLYFYRDYKNTIASVDEILKLTDNDLGMSCHGEPCLLLKGQALYRLGKFDEAVTLFTTFQKHEASQGFNEMDNSLIVFYKARCLVELGQNEEAQKYFLHLIANHPHAEAAYQLALIHFHKKEFTQTKNYLGEAEKALTDGYSFKEPYFERFDKVFPYQIDELRDRLNQN